MSDSPELENYKELTEELKSGNPVRIQSATGRAALGVVHAIVNMRFQLQALGRSTGQLTEKIQDFSDSTTKLSEKANKLIFWYVVLTAVIAVATVINILVLIFKK